MTKAWNQLLYWLSNAGDGSYEQLDKVCKRLQLEEHTWRVRRQLQLLGHIEVQPGAQRWSIAPSSWVQTPDRDRWFLCGQRSAAWLQHPQLKHSPQSAGPDIWFAERPLELEPGHLIHEAGCSARQLREILLPMEAWISDLVPVPLHHHPSQYAIRRWHPEQRCFEAYTYQTGVAFKRGIYEFKRDVGRYTAEFRLYFDANDIHKGSDQFLVADFTGLRFVSEYNSGMGLKARYNPQSRELWLLKIQRWPYIYERCLILCQGELPRLVTVDGQESLYYQQIPEDLLQAFTSDLSDVAIEMTEDSLYV